MRAERIVRLDRFRDQLRVLRLDALVDMLAEEADRVADSPSEPTGPIWYLM